MENRQARLKKTMWLAFAMLAGLELQSRGLYFRTLLLFVISMRYPRSHVIHVQVYDIDSVLIEDLNTIR